MTFGIHSVFKNIFTQFLYFQWPFTESEFEDPATGFKTDDLKQILKHNIFIKCYRQFSYQCSLNNMI